MKRIPLIALLTIFSFAAHSQSGRNTTAAEYNYLVKGNYEANLPKHHLVKSSVYYVDGNQAASIWQLYRDGESMQCALVIIYYKDNKPLSYIAIPDVKSPASMWNDYNKRLGSLSKDGKALQVISVALGKFAASE